jgi:L-fuculokinase
MKKSIPVILIFDIGKTNKKWLVFDQSYKAISISFFEVEETRDKDGYPAENLQQLKEKILQIAFDAIHNIAWDVKAINFTAYGATVVNTDTQNNLVHEITNYLKPYPEGILDEFNRSYNNQKDLLLSETASPLLENLNTALQLYALKKTDPAEFERIQFSTHLPQYLSSLFTGVHTAELTSIGCHTLSWDLSKKQYHDWTKKEGIELKFPPIQSARLAVRREIANKDLFVGIGLHDSSAALLPYTMTIRNPFMLLSTGSWCICLNPFNHSPLTRDELIQDCLCYLNVDGQPVKASRLNAGFVHAEVVAGLCSHFNNTKEDYLGMQFDEALLLKVENLITQKKNAFSPFEPADWSSYQEAYTAAMVNMVEQQVEKIRLVSSNSIEALFVDGGFSKNNLFMQLLRKRLPEYKVYAAEVGQSTAMGAALVVHSYWNSQEIPENLVTIN